MSETKNATIDDIIDVMKKHNKKQPWKTLCVICKIEMRVGQKSVIR